MIETFVKIFKGWKTLTIFAEKLYHRCLIRSETRPWKSMTILVPQGGIGTHYLKVNIQVQYKKSYFNNSKNFAYKLVSFSLWKSFKMLFLFKMLWYPDNLKNCFISAGKWKLGEEVPMFFSCSGYLSVFVEIPIKPFKTLLNKKKLDKIQKMSKIS